MRVWEGTIKNDTRARGKSLDIRSPYLSPYLAQRWYSKYQFFYLFLGLDRRIGFSQAQQRGKICNRGNCANKGIFQNKMPVKRFISFIQSDNIKYYSWKELRSILCIVCMLYSSWILCKYLVLLLFLDFNLMFFNLWKWKFSSLFSSFSLFFNICL